MGLSPAPNATSVPLGGGTMTGELVVPDLKVSGLTGATAASRYVGATTSGAPVSGTFAVGDYVIDQTGTIWTCVTAGTPGTWVPAGSGLQLASAELSTNPAALSASPATTDIAGLSITLTAPSRSFVVKALIPETLLTGTAATTFVQYAITDSANQALCIAFGQTGASGLAAPPIYMEVELPSVGTGAFAITPGNSYTFKVRGGWGGTGATGGQIQTNSGTTRPFIRAITV